MSVADVAEKWLVEELGLPLPKKPVHEPEGEAPEWPRNIADLTPDDLAHHMTWWSGYETFAKYQLARIATTLASIEDSASLKFDKFMFKSQGDYPTVTAAKAAFRQKPENVSVQEEILGLQAQVKMLSALVEGYEKKFAVISREVSRREMELGPRTRKGKEFT